MKLTILGCNAAAPAYGRKPTAQLLNINEENFLIDCGEGTQMRIQENKARASRIHHIFISHLHGDHFFGLIGLVNTMSLLGRQAPLHIYGPKKLKEIIEIQLQYELSFKLHFRFIEEGERAVLLDKKSVEVRCFPVNHSVPTHGFIFTAKQRQRSLNLEALRKYEVPKYFYSRLTEGEDYTQKNGDVLLNSWLTHAGKKNKKFAYTADTSPHECYKNDIRKVDLLYHESTYTKMHQLKASERFHSTAAEAATVAKECEVEKLLIGHYSSRYKELDEFLEEAKPIFENTVLAREGAVFEI